VNVVGLIGHPVAHSVSPAFQQAALDAAGIDARYEAWDTPLEALGEQIERVRESDCLGANVTVPHKEAVIPLLDKLSPSAAEPGAVNVIVNRGGSLEGHNTDGAGLAEALRARSGFDPEGGRFLLLGAGGAARGIAFSLAGSAAEAVLIANRTLERAMDLAEDIAAAHPECEVRAVPWRLRTNSLSEVGCLINSTSIGMEGGQASGILPLSLVGAPQGLLVVDIVYNPLETPLLTEARRLALRTQDGVAMLVHQGAMGFELWTGESPDLKVMFDAAYRALGAARG
jgi:shikimate dehydrogenase